jgi:hypothetical protein
MEPGPGWGRLPVPLPFPDFDLGVPPQELEKGNPCCLFSYSGGDTVVLVTRWDPQQHLVNETVNGTSAHCRHLWGV